MQPRTTQPLPDANSITANRADATVITPNTFASGAIATAETKAREIFDGRQNFNNQQLSPIVNEILEYIGDRGDEKLKSKLAAIIKEIHIKLHEENIYAGVEKSKEPLKNIIISELLNDTVNLPQELNKWVRLFRTLESDNTHIRLAAQNASNITNSLLNDSLTAWGDDADLVSVLQAVITDEEFGDKHYKSNHAYILAPAPLVAGEHEVHSVDPIKTITDKINAVKLYCSEKENVHLRIPVNCGQAHWRLLNVTISNTRVIQAELIDSINNNFLKDHSSYKNAQAIVNGLNKDTLVVVEAKSTGMQTDGFRCMDYVIQGALRTLPRIDIENDAKLVAIRDADVGPSLRIAVIHKIKGHHPSLENYQDLAVAAQEEAAQGLYACYKQIAHNFSNELRQQFNILEEQVKTHSSLRQISKLDKDINDYKHCWEKFTNAFLDNLRSNDLIFADIADNQAEIKSRFHSFNKSFHPDKWVNHQLFPEAIATEVTQNVIKYHDNVEKQSTVNVNQYMDKGNADFEKYESAETSENVAIRQNARNHLINAIENYKIIVKAVNEEFRIDKNVGFTDNIIDMQIEARIKLGRCYELLHFYFNAQIYIIGALRFAEHYNAIYIRKEKIQELRVLLSRLKSVSVSSAKQKEMTLAPEDDTSSKELLSIANISSSSEIFDAVQLCLTLAPEGFLVRNNIQESLSKQIAVNSKRKTVGTIASLTGGAVGLGLAGIGTITTILAVSAGSLLAGPIGWLVSSGLMISLAIFTGIKVVLHGIKNRHDINVKEEYNRAIDESFNHYKNGNYQGFIERLSAQIYFPNGEPLLHYEENTEGMPISIDKGNIKLIDTLLSHGFRPDGIAFLLNLIVEVLLTGRIRKRASQALMVSNAIIILNEILRNEKLTPSAKAFDADIAKEQAERTMLNSQNEAVKKIVSAKNSVTENVKTVYYGYSQKIPEAYLNDFKEMTVLGRLEEMRNVARINYAIALLLGNYVDDSSTAAVYLLKVRENYKGTMYENLIGNRIELIEELMISLGISLEVTNEKTVANAQDLIEAKLLHSEFNAMTPVVAINSLSGRISDQINRLVEKDQINERIYALLLLDKLFIEYKKLNWSGVSQSLTDLIASLKIRKYNIDNEFHKGFSTIISLYATSVSDEYDIIGTTQSYLTTLMIHSDINKIIIPACAHIHYRIKSPAGGSQFQFIPLAKKIQISNRQEGLCALLEDKLDNLSTMLIKPLIDNLTVIDLFKLIIEASNNQENNFIINERVKRTWSNLFPDSYKLYVGPLWDQIIIMLFAASNESVEFSREIVGLRLSLINKVQRQELFKELLDDIMLLRGESSLKLELIKRQGFELANTGKNTPADYKSLAMLRMKLYFQDDLNSYRDVFLFSQQQSLFAPNPEKLRIHNTLNERVIGQRHATGQTAETLIEFKTAKTAQKPPVYLLCGPTGVGKTELAKALASVINKSRSKKDRFVDFNMEQYSSPEGTSKLFGSDPGYSGSKALPPFAQKMETLDPVISDNEGVRLGVIRDAVILFDEIEKASIPIKQSLLTLFDACTIELTCTMNEQTIILKYQFENCLFVCTSNLCSTMIVKDFRQGLALDIIKENFKSNAVTIEPRLSMTPEWIGRTTIIPFFPISKGVADFQAIIRLNLIRILNQKTLAYPMIKTSINTDDLQIILEALENEHYHDGTNIRALQQGLERIFTAGFNKLTLTDTEVYKMKIGFCKESKMVSVYLFIDFMGEDMIMNNAKPVFEISKQPFEVRRLSL